MISKIDVEPAPSIGAIWDEFSEEHQHQCTQKHYILCPIGTFLCKLRCRLNSNTHFNWETNKFTKATAKSSGQILLQSL